MIMRNHWSYGGCASHAIGRGIELTQKVGCCTAHPSWQPIEVWFCPLDSWLVPLSQGWSLPWIAGPMAGYHGTFAVLLERPALWSGADSGTSLAEARQ